jgi:hypothetical protein
VGQVKQATYSWQKKEAKYNTIEMPIIAFVELINKKTLLLLLAILLVKY